MEPLRIGDREFQSRLFVGSGKYRDYDQMVACWEASGTECVTVALRRVDLKHERETRNLLDVIDRKRFTILPNTAAATTP
jgi:thiazole synthase